jgi:uncharacterized SAM-binding protein YcdF (DUF218 family)
VIKRIGALAIIIYALGMVWFAMTLPGASGMAKADGIVVLTGAPGRMQRALALLTAGRGKRLLVSGVDQAVRRAEFDVVYKVPAKLSACCIDLGKEAVDTISNARETAVWVRKHKLKSVLLVTSDWHMRRARFELERALGSDAQVVSDAVKTSPRLWSLFKEYNKYLARRVSVLFGA